MEKLSSSSSSAFFAFQMGMMKLEQEILRFVGKSTIRKV
jgi:hypothetical protein